MNTTRRDAMKFAGGSAAGLLLTPAPWRLITDTALWSENWPGIPRPARGAVTAKYTNCALCPAGCAVKARCVAGQPVWLAGVPEHPLHRGAMCPFGLAGHHLPYHPQRLQSGTASEAAAAVTEGIARCGANEHVALLDLRPGRTASWTYRRAMAGINNGVYVTPPQAFGDGTAVDLSQARTVLSFSIPVLAGWGTPGNVIASRGNFRLIQVEAVESHTAALADEWLRIRPGTDEILAQGIVDALAGQSASGAAAACGVSEAQIVAIAGAISHNGPALVLAYPEVPTALRLNELVDSLGQTIVARREPPVPDTWKNAAPVSELAALPDNSVRVLVIDESYTDTYIPWSAIEPKLVRDNPVVVALAWSREGYARHTKYAVPTGVYPETREDIPTAVDSVAAVFRIAVPLIPERSGTVKPEDWVAGIAKLPVTDTLRERTDAIHKSARGTLFSYSDAKTTPVKSLTADDFWKALNEGACWIDDAQKPARPSQFAARQPAAQAPHAAEGSLIAILAASPAPGSPILSKLYAESNLLIGPDRAALHPDTIRACGVEDGSRAAVKTAAGKCEVRIHADASVPPGVVVLAARPPVLDLFAPGTPVKVVRI